MAKKTSTKKTTAKKATKKASSKATKSTASAAKKSSKKVNTKKAAVKKATAKKATKSAAKKSSAKKATKKAAAEAPVLGEKKKIKIAVNLGPAKQERHGAPGVRIEKIFESARPAVEPKKETTQKRLSKSEIKKIRERLIDKREQLLGEIRHQVDDSLQRNAHVSSDSADRAADVYDGEISYGMAAAAAQELERIALALDKIDAGTFGECESCGCYIGRSRLKVLPFAIMCTGCRQEEESSKKGGNGSIWGFLDADAQGEEL